MKKIENLSTLFIMLAVICMPFLSSCTDAAASTRALTDEGYTEVEITGYDYFGCSKDDTFHTGFRAKNVKGVVVTGVVCCGILKSCTVRH